jgi:hypothetical protein
MASRQEDEEPAQGQPLDDTTTIVTALTQLLLDDPLESLNTASTSTSSAPRFSSIGVSTGNRSLEMQRQSSSSVDVNDTFPLPGFLADSQVRMALRHAASLQTQGLPIDVSPTHLSPPFAQHPRFQRERDAGAHVALDFHPSLGPSGYPTSSYVPPSPVHPYPHDPVSGSFGIPEKFAPGK